MKIDLMTKKCMLTAVAGLLASVSAGAGTIVADFFPKDDTAGFTTNTVKADAYPANTTVSSYTYIFDIASFSIGAADEMRITLTTANPSWEIVHPGNNGIAVNGDASGQSVNWWESTDGNLTFSVAVFDNSNNDITGDLDIDLTGFSMRWDDGTDIDNAEAGADPTVTVAGETKNYGGDGTVTQEGFSLATGETSETSFTAARTLNGVAQFQQLQFNIIPEPGSLATGIVGLAVLCLRNRRRRA